MGIPQNVCKPESGYLPGYLSIGAEFLYAPVREGLKTLLFTSYNRNIPSAKRLYRRLSYQLTLYSDSMAVIMIM